MLVICRLIIRLIKKVKSHVGIYENLPNYEEEYMMAPTHRYFLVDEYIDMGKCQLKI